MPKKTHTQKPLILAYDIGGTKVAIGIVDSAGKILTSHREPIAFHLGKKKALKQIIALGHALLEKYPSVQAVGISSAGPLDLEKGDLLDPINFRSPEGRWGRVPLVRLFKKEFHLPVFLENDAVCALLAEKWLGLAKKEKNVFVLTLGTGLGTAALCNGELVRSGRNLHAEAGHLILDASDPSAPCGCGNVGCAEAYLSGKNFVQRVSRSLKNDRIDASQIILKAQRGDKKFLNYFNQYAQKLSELLYGVSRIYSPELVIFTGSFARAFPLFSKNTQKTLGKMLSFHPHSKNLLPKLKRSRLKNNASLLGGAYVAWCGIKKMKKIFWL